MKAQSLKPYREGKKCRKKDFYTATVVAFCIFVIGNHLGWYQEYTLDMAFVFWLTLSLWRVIPLLFLHTFTKGEEKEKYRKYLVGYGMYVDE